MTTQPRRISDLKLFLLIVGGLMAAAMVAVVMIIGLVHLSQPYFSVAERQFLTELKYEHPTTSWPADRDLVAQGHQICTLQDQGIPKDSLTDDPLVGPPQMPPFLERYPYGVRVDLVYIATRHLCPQHSLWVGGIPI